MSELIILDFSADWIKHIKADMLSSGFKFCDTDTDFQIGNYYFNIQKRLISQVPRCVHRSSEFSVSPCYSSGFNELVRKAEVGENLNPYLSKKIKTAEYNDLLLNDWGIHHFHLGVRIHDDGFIERTRHLAFALVRQRDIYFIQIYNHDSWCDKDVMDILYQNWPELLKPFKINIKPTYPMLSYEQKSNVRDKHCNVLYQSGDGTVFSPPGGGFAGSGLSIEIVVLHDKFTSFLQKVIEPYINEHVSKFEQDISDRGGRLVKPYHFRLVFEDDFIYAIEMHNKDLVKWNFTSAFVDFFQGNN